MSTAGRIAGMAEHDRKPPASEGHVYGKTPGASDWKRITRLVALIALVVFVVLFFVTNRETVEVSLVVATVSIPLVFVLMLVFLLGMATMYLLTYLRRRSGRKATSK